MVELYRQGLFGIQKCRTDSNDLYYTPDDIAKLVIEFYKPKGTMLEPCSGKGALLKYMPKADHCEITAGSNFFAYKKKVNWIITNPPFSKITPFLIHSLELANNVVFIMNIPALFTVKRIREIHNRGFGIKKILYLKQPDTWCQTGRQLAAVYMKKYHTGFCKIYHSDNFDQSYKKFK